jgi:hypothetical protein
LDKTPVTFKASQSLALCSKERASLALEMQLKLPGRLQMTGLPTISWSFSHLVSLATLLFLLEQTNSLGKERKCVVFFQL